MAFDLADPRLPPWWQPPWEALQARRRAGTLPHALLIAGAEGMGKEAFAAALAASLLCQRPAADGRACGECHGCQLRAAGSHPDLLQLVPEEAGKAIKIDPIRAQNAFLALTAQYGGHKISLIAPADRMTGGAANALLKTLEEPAAGTLLLLVSARPAALPATVRSRCQRIEAPRPTPEAALAWLAGIVPEAGSEAPLLLDLAEGAPFRAAEMARSQRLAERSGVFEGLEALAGGRADPVALAGRWQGKPGVDAVIYWLSRSVTDMIRMRFAGAAGRPLNRDRTEILQQWARRSDALQLWRFLDRVEEAQRQVASQASLNPLLLLEDLLIGWHELTARVA